MAFIIFMPALIVAAIMIVCTYIAFFKKTQLTVFTMIAMWIGGIIAVYLRIESINSSSSSTAGLGALALPSDFIGGALVGGTIGFIFEFVKRKPKKYGILLLLFVAAFPLYFLASKLISNYKLFSMQKMSGLATTEFVMSKDAVSIKIEEILAIVKNHNTSSGALEKIANFSDPSLHYTAKSSAQDTDTPTMCYIAYHPNVNESTLRKLKDSRSSYVRGCVALNEKTPKDIILELEKEITSDSLQGNSYNRVIVALLSSDKIPENRLRRYYDTIISKKVDAARNGYLVSIMKNPNFPQDVLYKIAEEQIGRYKLGTDKAQLKKKLSTTEVKEMSKIGMDVFDTSYNLLLSILSNPSSKDKILDLFLEEKKFQPYLLKNPNLNNSQLEKLSHSSNRWIAQEATKILNQKN